MSERSGVCEECNETFSASARGPIGKWCANCRYKRQLRASANWKNRNRDAIRDYQRAYDMENAEQVALRLRRYRAANAVRIAAKRKQRYEERQRPFIAAVMREYRLRNPGKQAEIENRRRARLLDAFVAPVDQDAIRARDDDLCGICGEFVSADERSMDHIVPLARGGTHEPDNVQLAHRRCNSRKGARGAVRMLPKTATDKAK